MLIKTLNRNIDNLYLFFLLLFPVLLAIGSAVTNLNLFFIIIFGIFFIKQKKFNLIQIKKKYLFFLFLFFIYIIISSLIKSGFDYSFYKSIGYLRFFFVIIFYILFFDYKPEYLKYFFQTILMIVVVISIDALFQFFLGKNFLGGYEYTQKKGYLRLTGIFEDRQVVGSFILKILFIGLIFFDFIKNKYFYNKLKTPLILLTILLASSVIIFSGERGSVVLLFIFIVLTFLLNKNFIKSKLISLLFILFFLILLLNENFQTRFKQIFHLDLGIGYNLNIKDTAWGAHYLTSIEIFKDNLILGSGIKSYRYKCSQYEVKSKSNNIRCSTHTHNLFLEVLSETGIIGILIFVTFIIYFFKEFSFFNFRKMVFAKISILINMFSFFIPIFPSGSFFSTFNASLIWLSFISLIIIHNHYKPTNYDSSRN